MTHYTTTLTALAFSTLICATPVLAAGPHHNSPGASGMSFTPVTLDTLDEAETEHLLFMREEERLARDLYLGFDAIHNQPPFEYIAVSERNHMDAIKGIMDRYGLEDPSDPDDTGVYASTALELLHADLAAQGALSYEDALLVGALVEEVDIVDLQDAIDDTANADVLTLYDNLMRGSRNHLRVFVGELKRLDADYDHYAPQSDGLSQEEINAILSSPMERGGFQGGADGRGSGARAGHGAHGIASAGR